MSLSPHTPLTELALRLVLALAIGAAIGWERERMDKPAGLRTHMLVTLGAATFALVGIELLADTSPDFERVRLDPIRVLEGIIGGIGFLGAGSIIRGRGGVEGITTAASVWVAGGVGAAIGLGMYVIAVSVAVLVLVTLALVGMLERKLFPTRNDDGSPPSSERAEAPGE